MKLKTKFQDEDFDLGEVIEANVYHGGSERIKVIAEPTKGGMITFYFETLKGMNEMFEDAPEEPDVFYYIDADGVIQIDQVLSSEINMRKSIGNYFETKEEADKAVEKLKAWKRLEEKGFHWLWYNSTPAGNSVDFHISEWDKEATRDIDLLFGGEE